MAAWPEFEFDSEFESATEIPNMDSQQVELAEAYIMVTKAIHTYSLQDQLPCIEASGPKEPIDYHCQRVGKTCICKRQSLLQAEQSHNNRSSS